MKKISKLSLAVGLCAGLAGTAHPAWAAGGHHAADDAAMLEPGQCQLETWFERETGTTRRLLHLGPACRLGPVELGLNLDRQRLADAGTTSTLVGSQLKWAQALGERLSVGLALSASWQSRAPRYQGSTLVLPLSLQLSDHWLAHINLGRDFRAGQADGSRAAAALEWSPQAAWSLIGECFRDGGTNHWRLGGRWNLTPGLSLDLSRAQGPGAQPAAWWTLGLNLVIDR